MKPETKELIVDSLRKIRVDMYLAEKFPEYSRSFFQRLIRKGKVLVCSEQCRTSKKVTMGDTLHVEFFDDAEGIQPESHIKLYILHEDKEIMIINKQPGIVVHPAAGNTRGTLANALVAHIGTFGDSLRPGIVHRLDKYTSGVMVIARTVQAHAFLGKQFASRCVQKWYLAIVHGIPKDKEAVIDLPIGRDPVNRQKMAIVSGGKNAETYFRKREFFGSYTLVEIRPYTGRTHQIRVHMAYLGFPVIGDDIYGYGNKHLQKDGIMINRLMLHAWKISFIHPQSRENQEYCAPIPEDFKNAWKAITLHRQVA